MKRRIQELKPNTRIRLIVDGFAVYCRVKDISSHEGIQAVEAINRELSQGVLMTGQLAQYGQRQIQIDW